MTSEMENRNMLIDKFLSQFQLNEIHSIRMIASQDEIYPLVRHLDFNASVITRVLFKLRGLQTEDRSMDKMLANNTFAVLEEHPPEELVIGLLVANKFKPVFIKDGVFFQEFNEDESLKIAWNFFLQKQTDDQTLVSTETRILYKGKRTKRIFRIYWFFIRPFSGLIRREMLRVLKNQIKQKQSLDYPV